VVVVFGMGGMAGLAMYHPVKGAVVASVRRGWEPELRAALTAAGLAPGPPPGG
jgi:hypothetical protein